MVPVEHDAHPGATVQLQDVAGVEEPLVVLEGQSCPRPVAEALPGALPIGRARRHGSP